LGGSSGIRIIDDINPLHDEGAVGTVVNTVANDINKGGSDLGNSVNQAADSDAGRALIAAGAIAGGAYLLGPSGAGWWGASEAAVAPGAAGVTIAEPATGYIVGASEAYGSGGVGMLGVETSLAGSVGAAPAASNVGYLGVNTALSSTAAVETAAASAPWYSSILNAGGEVVKTAATTALTTTLLGGNKKAPDQPTTQVRGPTSSPGTSQFVPGRETTVGGSSGVAKAGVGNLAAVAVVGVLGAVLLKRFSK
jgi:hypothetical protein